MVSSTIYASVDIGESFTKLVVGTIHSEKVHICANYMAATKGVRDGEIISKTELQTTLTTLFEQANKDGYEVKEIVLVLPSNNMNVYRKRAESSVGTKKIVTSSDIELLKRAIGNVIKKASKVN